MIELKEGGLNDADDNNVGIDDSKICYPGVYTCVTLTCVLGNTRLVGAHLARMWSNGKINSSLNRILELSHGSTILSVFIVGMLSKWTFPQNRMKAGNFATETRAILGPNLPVWIFDTTGVADTVAIDASRVGAGTHAAFIDVRWGDDNTRFLKPTDFTVG
jgi:hypothetical protein